MWCILNRHGVTSVHWNPSFGHNEQMGANVMKSCEAIRVLNGNPREVYSLSHGDAVKMVDVRIMNLEWV